ncbi:hypothetical protein RHMOL_Rhmol13G0257400 [Rhododendron molle]|uniref:Uncharacterized protein n=1 Tax=Rhododendron molle TaxID=49168 RepID=A0ACC0LBT0_RHOML|nr:hypothetical protein RHMOL_Rhmol13G0257400 [Rhododendron molle]
MATKPSTCFFGNGWSSTVPSYCSMHSDLRFSPLPSHRFYPAYCKMRQRNFGSQQKKPAKKATPERLPTNASLQQNVDEDSKLETLSTDNISSLKYENKSNDGVDTILAADNTNEKDVDTLTVLPQIKPSV